MLNQKCVFLTHVRQDKTRQEVTVSDNVEAEKKLNFQNAMSPQLITELGSWTRCLNVR